MQNLEDKNIEKFIDNIMKDVIVDKPTTDFTDQIMSQISVLEQKKVISYKPLISKKAWIFISIGLCVLFGYLFFGNYTSSGWFSTVDLSTISDFKMPKLLSGITMSKTLLYSVVFFALMLCIQIPLLKNYFDKRLGY